MNTSSPRRKCLTQPKCNSRKSILPLVEKTTSLNILISFILSLQPASARKSDIYSSDVPVLFQDHPGRIKLQPNPAQVQRSVIMSLHAWLASWFCIMQFDLYLSDYRHNESKSMTFISTFPPPSRPGIFSSCSGLSPVIQPLPKTKQWKFVQECPGLAAHIQFIFSCITALRPWRASATPTHTNTHTLTGPPTGLPPAGLHQANHLPLAFSS